MSGPVDQDVASFNNQMVGLAEHWDPFITERIDRQPIFWHDRIPRESYSLYSGLDHKRNVFRGGLMHQVGTKDWRTIALSAGNSLASGGSTTPWYNN